MELCEEMKVASIQLAAGDWTKEEQIQRARELIGRVGDADLILLPELWTSGAFAYGRMEGDAEPLEGPTLAAMREVAREGGCHLFAGSWVERSEEGLHNTAVFLSPEGEVLKTYRKIHLFGYESKEREMMVPGDSPAVVKTPLGTFGLATCYDLRFPELFRGLVDRGMEVCVFASAFSVPTGRAHWDVLLRARAIENQVYVVAADQYGPQTPRLSSYGHSAIYDPWGKRLCEAGDDGDAVLIAEIDPAHQAKIRRELPSLTHRRKLEGM